MEPKEVISCPDCGTCFKEGSSLDGHVCPETRVFQCPECDKSFKTRTSFRKHFKKNHVNIRRFGCSECARTFFTGGEFKKHMLSAHKEDRPIKCRYCEKTFKQKSKLEIHLKEVHAIIPFAGKTFACPKCKKGFTNESDLDKHKQSHGNSGGFQCARCPAIFKKRGLFEKHLSSVHKKISAKDDGPFPCGRCGKIFKNRFYLDEHSKSHKSTTQHSCSPSGTRFDDEKQLKLPKESCEDDTKDDSSVSHSDEAINVSDISFVRPSNFAHDNSSGDKSSSSIVEIEQHKADPPNDATPFECRECHEKFKAKRELQDYILKQIENKPYACSNCGRRFALEYDLNDHKRRFCQDFKCRQCEKTLPFTDLHLIVDHIQSHLRFYPCSSCGNSYYNKDDLNVHERSCGRSGDRKNGGVQ